MKAIPQNISSLSHHYVAHGSAPESANAAAPSLLDGTVSRWERFLAFFLGGAMLASGVIVLSWNHGQDKWVDVLALLSSWMGLAILFLAVWAGSGPVMLTKAEEQRSTQYRGSSEQNPIVVNVLQEIAKRSGCHASVLLKAYQGEWQYLAGWKGGHSLGQIVAHAMDWRLHQTAQFVVPICLPNRSWQAHCTQILNSMGNVYLLVLLDDADQCWDPSLSSAAMDCTALLASLVEESKLGQSQEPSPIFIPPGSVCYCEPDHSQCDSLANRSQSADASIGWRDRFISAGPLDTSEAVRKDKEFCHIEGADMRPLPSARTASLEVVVS